MNRKNIDDEVAVKLDIRKDDIKVVIDCWFETLVDHMLSGDEIMISNFGKFGSKVTSERNAWDNINKKPIIHQGNYLPKFKFSGNFQKRFKEKGVPEGFKYKVR